MKKSNNTNWYILLAILGVALIIVFIFILAYPTIFKEPISDIDDEHYGKPTTNTDAYRDLVRSLPISSYFDNSTSPCVNYYTYACGNYHESQNLVLGSLAVEIREANKHSIISKLPDTSSHLTIFFNKCTDALLGNQQAAGDGALMDLLFRIEKATDPAVAIRYLHERGIMPFVTFIRDDDLLRWNRSVWTREIPHLTDSACGYLHVNGFVPNKRDCVFNTHFMFTQLEQIFQGKMKSEDFSSYQMKNQFPILYTHEFDGTHRVWSPVQMLSIHHLLRSTPVLKTYLQVITMLDAAQYIPSIWGAADRYISYAALSHNPHLRHARDFFYFRNGIGPFGLNASRSTLNEAAKGAILESCLFMTEQMLPHLNQDAVISQEDHDSAEALGAELKAFTIQIIMKSKSIFEIMKTFLKQHLESLNIVFGFPGDTPHIAWNSPSFLELAWEIRRFQMDRVMSVLWPPSFLSGSCDSEIMLRDHTIFIPMCLYQNNWFRELLPTIIFHEIAHLLDPRAIAELGGPKDATAVMKNALKKMSNPTLEHFADIIGLRLSYEFCKARGKCANTQLIRAFLIKHAQMWCNASPIGPVNVNYGTDEDRMINAFYYLLDTNNVHPLSAAYKCSANSLFFANPVPFF